MLKSSYRNGGAMVELVNVDASSCPLLDARLCSPEHHPPHPRAELRACTRAGGASSHPGCRAVILPPRGAGAGDAWGLQVPAHPWQRIVPARRPGERGPPHGAAQPLGPLTPRLSLELARRLV